MATQRYSLLHTAMQGFASSRFGAWLFARTLQLQDRIVLKLTGGRWTVTGLLAGLPVVWVTATGVRSGRTRTVPLLGIPDEPPSGAIALVGTNFGQQHHPAWYFNLKANPQVTCKVRGQSKPYVAHEASGQEYDKFWQRATEVYHGYPVYKLRMHQRAIPIMVLTPSQP